MSGYITTDHPAVFDDPEAYDLFITQSISKAALRGCGLGLFSLKATPGDITELDDADEATGPLGFWIYAESRTEYGSNVRAHWAPGDPHGDLHDWDDPTFIQQPRERREPRNRAVAADAGSRCPALSPSGAQCGLLLYSCGTHYDFPDHVAATGEAWRDAASQRPGDRFTIRPAWRTGDYVATREPVPFVPPWAEDITPETHPNAFPTCGHQAPTDPRPLCMRVSGHDGPHCSLTDEQRDELDQASRSVDSFRESMEVRRRFEDYWLWV